MGRSAPVRGTMYFTMAILAVLLGLSDVRSQVRAISQVAQFIFGDSLVDQGNNNNLQSIAKANFAPNGVDLTEFNNQPTGRFSNGRLVSDFLSEYMGTTPVLAYNDANANGANLLRGCNFASAGSGILDDTGNIFIQHISMTQQMNNFQNVQSEISSMVGPAAASQLISNALFSFTTGGNDFVNNYLVVGSQRAQQLSIPQFTSLMISTFQEQIKTIYSYGARKISIANLGPLGCIPDQLATKSGNGACVDSINQLAQGFNSLLGPMLTSLNAQLPGATIVLSDSYGLVSDFINNPATYGFTYVNVACCGIGRFNGLIPCTAVATLCSDRSIYVFWDPFHPTEKATSIVYQKILFGDTSVISPINISTLIDM